MVFVFSTTTPKLSDSISISETSFPSTEVKCFKIFGVISILLYLIISKHCLYILASIPPTFVILLAPFKIPLLLPSATKTIGFSLAKGDNVSASTNWYPFVI